MEILKDYAERIERLASRSEIGPFFFGPIPETRLIEAERELGVAISGSFRAYLLHLGAAMMFGYDICGLPDEIQSDDAEYYYLSILDNTKEYRSFMVGLPQSFVFISDNGGEVTFWVDTSVSENGESPIKAHIYEKYISIADSFIEFVDLLTHPEDLYKYFN